jgi:hypothetical protein
LSGCGRRRHDQRVRLEWRRTVGVGRRRQLNGVSSRFSAYGIGSSRVCGKSCSTAIVGLRAPATSPLFMWCCATGGLLPYKASAPDQGADWIGFPIPEIFPKGKEIIFLTFSPLISISHLNSTIHLFTNQCTGHTASCQSVTYYQTQ